MANGRECCVGLSFISAAGFQHLERKKASLVELDFAKSKHQCRPERVQGAGGDVGQCLKWQELSGTVRRQRKGMHKAESELQQEKRLLKCSPNRWRAREKEKAKFALISLNFSLAKFSNDIYSNKPIDVLKFSPNWLNIVGTLMHSLQALTASPSPVCFCIWVRLLMIWQSFLNQTHITCRTSCRHSQTNSKNNKNSKKN